MAKKIFNAVTGGVSSILGLGSKSSSSAAASTTEAAKSGPIIKQIEARSRKKTATRQPSQVQSILRDTLGGD